MLFSDPLIKAVALALAVFFPMTIVVVMIIDRINGSNARATQPVKKLSQQPGDTHS